MENAIADVIEQMVTVMMLGFALLIYANVCEEPGTRQTIIIGLEELLFVSWYLVPYS
jgi:hypothetical protein